MCADEAKPTTACIGELADSIYGELSDQSETIDLSVYLMSSVANFKSHLEREGKRTDGPVEGLVQSVCIFRNDVSSLLERKEDACSLTPKS